jgi:hypothetical protein
MRVPSIAVALAALAAAWPVQAETLHLAPDLPVEAGTVSVGVMKPFDVYLVAERDSAHAQISAVGYLLEVGEGLVVAGEELLVESILGLGTSRTGMNLVFHCTETPRLRVLRFRVVATRPVQGAKLALRPETRMSFLGIVSCRAEDYEKFDCTPDSLLVVAR